MYRILNKGKNSAILIKRATKDGQRFSPIKISYRGHEKGNLKLKIGRKRNSPIAEAVLYAKKTDKKAAVNRSRTKEQPEVKALPLEKN